MQNNEIYVTQVKHGIYIYTYHFSVLKKTTAASYTWPLTIPLKHNQLIKCYLPPAGIRELIWILR